MLTPVAELDAVPAGFTATFGRDQGPSSLEATYGFGAYAESFAR